LSVGEPAPAQDAEVGIAAEPELVAAALVGSTGNCKK